MKKVLIITYYWPPAGGSGVQRWMYFAKNLKTIGHEVMVLTVDPKFASYGQIDDSLLKHVEGIETHSTKTRELIKLYSRITTRSAQQGIPQGSIEGKNTLFQKMARFIRGNFFIPDSRIGWNKYAIPKANELILSKKPDLIITTGPPHSTHLIGLQLKKTHSIKWLADFRDPWTEIYYNSLFYKTKWSKKRDQKLEKTVLEKADKVLTIGKNLCQLLETKNADSSKFAYIYNGYDEMLFESVKANKSEFFDIVFTGLLSKSQITEGLFNALKSIEKEIDQVPIRFLLAGKIDASILKSFQTELKKIEVISLGYLSHQKAVEMMVSSSILVTILPALGNLEIMISGKIMEYIAARKPLLIFGSDRSEAAQLVNSLPDSLISPEREHKQASSFLLKYYKDWLLDREMTVKNSNFDYSVYSRKNTALQLSELISRI